MLDMNGLGCHRKGDVKGIIGGKCVRSLQNVTEKG